MRTKEKSFYLLELIFLIFLMLSLLVMGGCECKSCEDDEGNGDVDTIYYYQWKVLGEMTIDSSVGSVSFNGISDEWQNLRLEGWGGVESDTFCTLFMRINNDSLGTYTWTDRGHLYHWTVSEIYLGCWGPGCSTLLVDIYQNSDFPGEHSVLWCIGGSIDRDTMSSFNNGYGSHFDPDERFVERVDVFLEGGVFKEGTYFVLKASEN